MKATVTIEVDDLAELARVFAALTGPQPATLAPSITWTTPAPAAVPPVSSPRSPAPRKPPGKDTAGVRMLRALHGLGGFINDPNGAAGKPIATAMGVDMSYVSTLLKTADHDGLVERTVDRKRHRTTRVALTTAGYEAIGVQPRDHGPTPAPKATKPDLSTPRFVEVLEEDDAPLVFKTREQRQQEIRDAQADVQYPRGEP